MTRPSCTYVVRHHVLAGAVAGSLALVAAASVALAQERPGRYSMSPVEGGFVRLDTETGAMSHCKAQPKEAAASGQWTCQPMGDTAADLRKLETENKDLRAEVKRMEDLLGLNGDKPKSDDKHAEQRPGGPGAPFNLPSEQEVDKALSYMERMVKKFHDTMKRLEGATAKGEGSKGI
jgi:hypothetical protein